MGVIATIEAGRRPGGVKLVGKGLDAAANNDALGRGIDVSEVDFIAGRGSARLSDGHRGRCLECHEGTPEGEGRKDNHHRSGSSWAWRTREPSVSIVTTPVLVVLSRP